SIIARRHGRGFSRSAALCCVCCSGLSWWPTRLPNSSSIRANDESRIPAAAHARRVLRARDRAVAAVARAQRVVVFGAHGRARVADGGCRAADRARAAFVGAVVSAAAAGTAAGGAMGGGGAEPTRVAVRDRPGAGVAGAYAGAVELACPAVVRGSVARRD